MQIDKELISYLEELSCLALLCDEKSGLTADLEKILGYMERLSEIDVENIAERSYLSGNVNAFREDIVTPSLDSALLFKNAPDSKDGMLIAPKTVQPG